jgi:hypothetical protein
MKMGELLVEFKFRTPKRHNQLQRMLATAGKPCNSERLREQAGQAFKPRKGQDLKNAQPAFVLHSRDHGVSGAQLPAMFCTAMQMRVQLRKLSRAGSRTLN